MKKALIVLTAVVITTSCNQQTDKTNESGPTEATVAAAVASFREVMLNPNQEVFEELLDESLTYGHSNGLIEDQATCIASMVSGKFKFTSLEFSAQTINVIGNTAIVRHELFGHTADEGKEPGTTNLKVLQVWIQKEGKLRLVARQAVKI
ncbi:nuclear transport factor 2 family protein [Parapedobacter koreensis]|uniref:DUF4440 domain-containing protein n=1 Tax=Parapedobacter koreensis TaxID=332977 RepID=A0A1H7G0L1_9SPHI|nr:nuclear transport factor 2 family protein [Parapedobacter koreensis]SEK29980.1 protein of unknown function [Parapedobacter koreensis]